MITYTHPMASILPIKTLVARWLQTSTCMHVYERTWVIYIICLCFWTTYRVKIQITKTRALTSDLLDRIKHKLQCVYSIVHAFSFHSSPTRVKSWKPTRMVLSTWPYPSLASLNQLLPQWQRYDTCVNIYPAHTCAIVSPWALSRYYNVFFCPYLYSYLDGSCMYIIYIISVLPSIPKTCWPYKPSV